MGNLLSWVWSSWGSGYDTPDPVSGMSPRDIYQVQKTWRPINAQAVANGMDIFLRFFRKEPQAQTIFKQLRGLEEEQLRSSHQFKAHVQNVMGSLNSAITILHEPLVVVAMFTKLGTTHNAFKVSKASFEVFRGVFENVLQNDLKLNENELKSWGCFVDFIYKIMFKELKI